MTRTAKRVLSLFLCLVLCLGLVPVSVLAAEEPRDEGIEIVNASEPIALFEEGSSDVIDEEPVGLEDESVDPSEPPVILSGSEGSPEEAPVDLIGETDAVDLSAADVNAETGTFSGMTYSIDNGEVTITGLYNRSARGIGDPGDDRRVPGQKDKPLCLFRLHGFDKRRPS